ncbi:MAG: sugar ABC transporter permease [Eisenbergiella sp.]
MNALKKDLKRNYSLYLIFLPTVIFFVIFSYGPMVGLLMAFQNYKPQLGFFRSPFVGFKHFQDFFQSYYFWRLLKNTFLISFLDLLGGFPLPIIFALLLNEVRGKFFKKSIQTISYMPYFVSMVVVCSLVNQFCSQNGAITQLWSMITRNEPASLIAQPQFFRAIFVGSNVWQSLGYNSIIYIAARPCGSGALRGCRNRRSQPLEADAACNASRYFQHHHYSFDSSLRTIAECGI